MTHAALWSAVDHYIEDRLLPADDTLAQALADSHEAGLPNIHVAPNQGKLLHLLARSIGARRVLEVGTLAGYSTIWLARALPADGHLLTIELNPDHAKVARTNLERAGVAQQVELVVAPALEVIATLPPNVPFDFVFIDADKASSAAYAEAAIQLTRPGGLVVVDNVVREGQVLDEDGDEGVQGARALFDCLSRDPRVSATALQTVGHKGHDGLVIALVN